MITRAGMFTAAALALIGAAGPGTAAAVDPRLYGPSFLSGMAGGMVGATGIEPVTPPV